MFEHFWTFGFEHLLDLGEQVHQLSGVLVEYFPPVVRPIQQVHQTPEGVLFVQHVHYEEGCQVVYALTIPDFTVVVGIRSQHIEQFVLTRGWFQLKARPTCDSAVQVLQNEELFLLIAQCGQFMVKAIGMC